MKATLSIVLSLVVICVMVVGVVAQDKKEAKEETLKGNITCAKCELNVEKKCTTVIVVKVKDKKDVVYYLDEKSHKAHHSKICTEGKEGTVIGTVTEKDGKKTVTASKVEFK